MLTASVIPVWSRFLKWVLEKLLDSFLVSLKISFGPIEQPFFCEDMAALWQVYMRQGSNPYSLAHDAGPSAGASEIWKTTLMNFEHGISSCHLQTLQIYGTVKHRNHQPWEIEVLYHVQQGLQAGTTYGFMAGLSLPEIELKLGWTDWKTCHLWGSNLQISFLGQ